MTGYFKISNLPVMSSIITKQRLLLASPKVMLLLDWGSFLALSAVFDEVLLVSCSQIAWINSKAYSVTSGLVVCLRMWQRAIGSSSDLSKNGYEDSSSAKQFKKDKQLLNTASFVLVSVMVSATTSMNPSLPKNKKLSLPRSCQIKATELLFNVQIA